MMDFKYWNISGPGVGIENIDVGLGLLDFMLPGLEIENSVTYYDDKGVNPTSATIPTEILTDFRFSDITLRDHNSLLTLG